MKFFLGLKRELLTELLTRGLRLEILLSYFHTIELITRNTGFKRRFSILLGKS
jgi:hypothetical protein